MTETRSILMLCGSLREGSSNESVLRTAATLLPSGAEATFYQGLADLPHFNPDDDHDPLPPAVKDLRAQIEAADALLICTPEYAGALPGSFLNLLDWTVGGVEISEKPTGWINSSPRTSPDGQTPGAYLAHESLGTVLRYTGADVVDKACLVVPVQRASIDADGIVQDEEARRLIALAIAALLRK